MSENLCDKCGKPLYNDGKTTAVPDLCKCSKEEKQSPAPLYGWVCPVCGKGNSPYSTNCPCVPLNYTVT